ncbi:MAG: pyruvate dehydrogenase (acetyl-transferring), homodimeric type [Candidatus Nanopelagicales bacterium]|jgi:pyruvate dehydrogenase E1 component|nr:pyruvate dehydrogenase (acetyl-transferring), homodimeric type [Candidatus Nanopelagicales bacterium]MDP4824273.1 pyruvate dehydrogenase (acetyl-transferring), homodimeric type [Candidatus Nanopelagicales bacterium]MDP4888280.1 pyruvate dehydrogenase (acetyl-transferring), homodimeric type [Candidatus Nanopelagicales bacterium]
MTLDPFARTQPLLAGGLPTQYVDVDPDETSEWTASLDQVIDAAGPYRARYLMLSLLRRAAERNVGIPSLRSTDYINTIAPEMEPWFPGDEAIERTIRRHVRWNAAVMVHRAQRPGIGVGGHISTYASSATLYEVGFNHFFRGPDHPGGGDQVYFQGHASPGIYARAYLEGRLTDTQLDGFRQELSHPGGGLPSYPHPRLMPWFWQFPTVSMGLGPLNAIYQARFNKYLHHRGIKDTSQQRVWAFLGDGEMDEVESVGALGLAAREELDNLVFVVNANLQRLDGPVRGNGKIIQELESLYRGAGWNVIKVIWGRRWDELLAQDRDGALVNIMNSTPDGDYQTYKAEDGAFVRDHFFGQDPRAAKLVEDWSDEEVWSLQRGGHDYRKVFAAYKAAVETTGQPTVILAKTIKGYTLGSHFEARNATHQMKKLTLDDLKIFRDRLQIPITDEELGDGVLPPYYHPGPDSDVTRYMLDRRRRLGGSVPERRVRAKALELPGPKAYEAVRRGSGKQPIATTMAFVRLLRDLLRDEKIGARFVPIIPDEARTFGMDSLFPTAKIYSPQGQQYLSVDRDQMLSYIESETGQILHEGINEAGSVASFTAAGSAYATHGEPMIPIYVFYSMFGFQRTGDGFWAAMDQMTRGFVLGATAGRTTLNGEGLQHEDGHSLLLAATNPAVVAYDPAYGYEIGHIVADGLKRMYGEDPEDIFYYLTVYNEPYPQPAEPDDVDVEGILRGMHRIRTHSDEPGPKVTLLASGVAVNWALKARELLANDWGVNAEVWSVTSWNELRRDGLACDRAALVDPTASAPTPYVTTRLADSAGPVVAVSDWIRGVADQIIDWVPGDYVSLGTDGWGMSDTRGALRRHFLVDAESITVRTLATLAKRGEVDANTVSTAISTYRLHDPAAADAGNTEGSG